MLDNKGFDLWANNYDLDVGISDDNNTYPFAGYKDILAYIYNVTMQKKNTSILDIGFGTATLSLKLYEEGHTVYGQDFSKEMISIASKKMPSAFLYQGDFSNGLVEPLLNNHYDFIVATYSLHHLKDNQKINFINELLKLLNDNGQILIGDVSFNTREELNKCRQAQKDEWDEDEYYFVIEELKKHFPNITYIPMSFCAGVIIILN